MACKYCNDKNKLVRTIAWAVYLAPLAYSAYVFLRESGAFEKAEPYVEAAKEKVSEAYDTAKEKAEEVYHKVVDSDEVKNIEEAVEDISKEMPSDSI